MGTELEVRTGEGQVVGLKGTLGGILHTVPYKLVWTAKGYGFQTMATAAVAALVVRPTTTAAFTLFNNHPSNSLVIERAFAHWLVSTAAQTFASIWLCSHPVGMTKPTNDITARNNTGGKVAGGSSAIADNGATVVADGWFPWGTQAETSATGVLPGAASIAEVDGRIIVPPSGAISMHVVSGLVGDTFTGGFHWFEVPKKELDIG